jgi:uncharacterized membrane protein HdeD (DUF308 family)
VTRNTRGMRVLPNIVGVFVFLFGCAWALAGLGYVRETSMSGSYIWAGIGIVAALFGAVILASVNRARFRLRRVRRSVSR